MALHILDFYAFNLRVFKSKFDYILNYWSKDKMKIVAGA